MSFLFQTLRRAVVGDLGLRPAQHPRGFKVYVSLTTTPPRIKNIECCLNSLFTQTVKPDKIFLCVPTWYRRYEKNAEIPESLTRFGERLQIISCPEDYGPGTKLLGSENLVRRDPNSLLILVDDDVVYQDYMLEVFVNRFIEHPNQSSSFCVSRYRGINVGHGVDGFAIPVSCLDGVGAFYRKIQEFDHVLFVDDLWISYYLLIQGIRIANLANFVRGRGVIYKTYNDADALIRKRGELSRRNCMKRARRSLQEIFER